jgi:heme/copper-type cytochrome/quinol oxidase subunit 3
VTVVFRSSTICEIETFITLESSTMMNWADARMINGSHLRTRRLYATSGRTTGGL